MAVVTMRQLLEAGVHFGHQTRRWNPKMKRYILTDRNSIYIIDLQKTVADIDRTYDFVKETVAHGGNILFIGTKKQAQEAIKEQAERVGMPYVNQRWLGGMLTNFSTVSKRLSRLKELEQVDFDDVASSGRTKKELLMMRREKEKLERTLGGIRDMNKVPSAVWVIDTNKEHLAVAEAQKLGIPVVSILDTNCDPDDVTYPIPGNDDSIGSIALLTRVIADAVAEGLVARSKARAGTDKDVEEEPMPEWERELLEADKNTADSEVAKEESAKGEAPVAKEAEAKDEKAEEAEKAEAKKAKADKAEKKAEKTEKTKVEKAEEKSEDAVETKSEDKAEEAEAEKEEAPKAKAKKATPKAKKAAPKTKKAAPKAEKKAKEDKAEEAPAEEAKAEEAPAEADAEKSADESK